MHALCHVKQNNSARFKSFELMIYQAKIKRGKNPTDKLSDF